MDGKVEEARAVLRDAERLYTADQVDAAMDEMAAAIHATVDAHARGVPYHDDRTLVIVVGDHGEGLDDRTAETVQISTMGGEIEVEDAPEGADLHTMGGDIRVTD